MRTKNFLTVAAFICFAASTYAQDMAMATHTNDKIESSAVSATSKAKVAEPLFTYSVYGDIPVAKTAFEEKHYLGDAITPKWNTFLSNYTRTFDVEIGLTSSGTEFRKPAIFKAVERANKYVKKSLKNNTMTNDEAIVAMAHILDCANVVCYEEDTKELEEAASNAKTGSEVIELFNRVKLVNE